MNAKIYLVLPLLLAACSNSDPSDPAQQPKEDNLITFSVNIDPADNKPSTTRGSLVEFYDDLAERDISVTSIMADENTYFSNNKLICTDGLWNTTVKNYWPPSQSLDFYAHLPFVDENINNATYNSFDYNLPKDNSGQYDLMYAITKGKTKGQEVQLNFKHALAALTFNAKTESSGLVVVISGIDLCNVMTKGTFNYPSSSTTGTTDDSGNPIISPLGSWTNIGTKGTLSAGIIETTLTTEALSVTSPDGALMLLPQTITAWNRGTDDNPLPISETDSYLVIHCSLLSNGLYLAGSEDNTDGLVYVPYGETFEVGKHYSVTLSFGLGYTSDGRTNQIKVSLESTITDWNREDVNFDKKIL